MNEFGIDAEFGFKLKRLNDLRSSMKRLLEQVSDPDSGQNLQIDLDEDDPFIQVINIFIDELSSAWELVQAAYGQFNPKLASGPALSGLVQLNGIVRKQGTPSTVVLTFNGSPGVIIPIGTECTDENRETVWKTSEEVSLDDVTGEATVTARSVENGIFKYEAGQINVIVDPITGLNTVINASPTIPGTDDETDEELRIRRKLSTTVPAQSIAESIYGAIMNLTGVKTCRICSNKTLETDERGIPAKTVAAIVVGGDDKDIAREIFKRIGVAVETFGNTSVTFSDSLQQNHVIRFIRPDEIEIYVNVDYTVIDTSTFPSNGADLIKKNIVAYSIRGVLGLGVLNENIFDQTGFLPGQSVVVSRLYTPVLAVPGIKVNSIEIGVSGSFMSANTISINWDEVAIFKTENIGVIETT